MLPKILTSYLLPLTSSRGFPRIAFSKLCFEKAILQRGVERKTTSKVKPP